MIRKTVVAFGTLFNDMYVYRKNSTGKIIQKIESALAYGVKQKFLTRLEQDSEVQMMVRQLLLLYRIGLK